MHMDSKQRASTILAPTMLSPKTNLESLLFVTSAAVWYFVTTISSAMVFSCSSSSFDAIFPNKTCRKLKQNVSKPLRPPRTNKPTSPGYKIVLEIDPTAHRTPSGKNFTTLNIDNNALKLILFHLDDPMLKFLIKSSKFSKKERFQQHYFYHRNKPSQKRREIFLQYWR